MKLGMMLPGLQSVGLNAAALHGAQMLGVDDVWLPDHMLGFTHPEVWPDFPASAVLTSPDAYLDPFVLAGVLGATSDLPIGTSVTDATRRRGPDLARAALTLHDACKGGFILGIAAGEAESIVPFGYDWRRPVGNLERALAEIRSLLDTGGMPDGGVGRLALADNPPKGLPQVWVAAGSPRTLRLTGRYADGWLPLARTPEEYARQLAEVARAAAEAGRPVPTASLMWATIFGESRERVAELLEERPVIKLVVLFAPAELWRRHGLEHPAGPTSRGMTDVIPHELDPDELRKLAKTIPFSLVEEFAMVGNADEIADRLRPYAQAGAQHVLIGDVTGTTYAPEEAMQYMGELARLKKMAAEFPST